MFFTLSRHSSTKLKQIIKVINFNIFWNSFLFLFSDCFILHTYDGIVYEKNEYRYKKINFGFSFFSSCNDVDIYASKKIIKYETNSVLGLKQTVNKAGKIRFIFFILLFVLRYVLYIWIFVNILILGCSYSTVQYNGNRIHLRTIRIRTPRCGASAIWYTVNSGVQCVHSLFKNKHCLYVWTRKGI